jgi:hypothetical protein
MSDPVQLALIAGIVSLIPSILSVFNNILGRRNEKHLVEMKEAVADVKNNVQTIEKATNSMKDELVKVTGEAEYAKGVKAEKEKNI